jgi:hypothetical protein
MHTDWSSTLSCSSAFVAGARSGNIEAPVANNPTVYGINAVVLALAAGLAAANPQLVSEDHPKWQHSSADLRAQPKPYNTHLLRFEGLSMRCIVARERL